jgi:hypothetical protein
MQYRKYWIALVVVLVASFTVLGVVGYRAINTAPPIPSQVVTTDGRVLFSGETIRDGQNVWQSIGGQEMGSIWGHGSYVAPDWTADWLHRESVYILNTWAGEQGASSFEALLPEQQAGLRARLEQLMRTNTYDPANGTVTLGLDRVIALSNVAAHYESLFGNDPATATLREDYAMKDSTVDTVEHRRALTAFIWWTAWAATTERPRDAAAAAGDSKQVTYTNNWPSEPLVGNTPAPLQPKDLETMLLEILGPSQRERLEQNQSVDLGYGLPGVARFRGNIFVQRGSLAGVFRRIPFKIPDISELGLPEVLETFVNIPTGLVLITGPTGSGKSTTLASIIRLIIEKRPVHIVIWSNSEMRLPSTATTRSPDRNPAAAAGEPFATRSIFVDVRSGPCRTVSVFPARSPTRRQASRRGAGRPR